jgi:hypothetical protein
VRASRSLTVTLRKEGQVELQGETPKQLGAARCCETCRNAVNIIFRREDTFFALHTATKYEFPLLQPSVCLVDGTQQIILLYEKIVIFIVGLLIATSWAQVGHAHGTVWVPGLGGTLNGRHNYQLGLRDDGVVVWRWSPYAETSFALVNGDGYLSIAV